MKLMEKTDLLLKTQELIREATPQAHNLLLHSGFEKVQSHVLNYFREDLDYPQHSARAVVQLASSMLQFIECWEPENIHSGRKAYVNLRDILELWSAQLKG
jgi:hypothetical protein